MRTMTIHYADRGSFDLARMHFEQSTQARIDDQSADELRITVTAPAEFFADDAGFDQSGMIVAGVQVIARGSETGTVKAALGDAAIVSCDDGLDRFFFKYELEVATS